MAENKPKSTGSAFAPAPIDPVPDPPAPESGTEAARRAAIEKYGYRTLAGGASHQSAEARHTQIVPDAPTTPAPSSDHSMPPQDRDFWIAVGLWGAALVTVLGCGLYAFIENSYWYGAGFTGVGLAGLVYLTLHLKGRRLTPRVGAMAAMLAATWVLVGVQIWYAPSNAVALQQARDQLESLQSRLSSATKDLNDLQQQNARAPAQRAADLAQLQAAQQQGRATQGQLASPPPALPKKPYSQKEKDEFLDILHDVANITDQETSELVTPFAVDMSPHHMGFGPSPSPMERLDRINSLLTKFHATAAADSQNINEFYRKNNFYSEELHFIGLQDCQGLLNNGRAEAALAQLPQIRQMIEKYPDDRPLQDRLLAEPTASYDSFLETLSAFSKCVGASKAQALALRKSLDVP